MYGVIFSSEATLPIYTKICLDALFFLSKIVFLRTWYIQYYYFSLGFGFVFEDKITSDFLVRSALIPAGKRGKSLIITLLYSTVFHNVCWTAKTQSGGGFCVSHFAKKWKCLADYFYLKWYCNVWGMLPQQDFVFYPVIIFQIGFHYHKGNGLRTLQNYMYNILSQQNI